MADYEELAELGFEAVDKGVEKYLDRVYNHLPAWKKKQQRQEAKDHRRRSYEQQQHNQAEVANETQRSRYIGAREGTEVEDEIERGMSSHGQSQATSSYAPSGRQDHRDYRDDRDDRYVRDESATSAYYKNSLPGSIVMRDNETDQRQAGYGSAFPNAPPPPPPPPAYGYANDDLRERGRPAPSRMRSNSWSPPRNQKQLENGSRQRRHSRSRSRSSSRGAISNNKERLAATLIGGLVGGFAGNRAGKGKKYDTAATIAGAVLGGLASREIAEKVNSKNDERHGRRQNEQQAWELKQGNSERGRDDDGRHGRSSRDYSRDSRGWCDRCGRERSRCRCR